MKTKVAPWVKSAEKHGEKKNAGQKKTGNCDALKEGGKEDPHRGQHKQKKGGTPASVVKSKEPV